MKQEYRSKLEDIARLNELSLGNVIRGLVDKATPKEVITKD